MLKILKKTIWDKTFWDNPVWKKIDTCTEELKALSVENKKDKLEELHALYRQLYTTE